MMKRQISKKKLERLTMQGGDYRKAGRREGQQQVTLSELKALLEDDVKNLDKREKEGHGIGGTRSGKNKRGSGPAAVVELDCDGEECGAAPSAPAVPEHGGGDGDWIQRDISDAELDMIMNRDRLFPLSHLSHKKGAGVASADAKGVKAAPSCVSLQSAVSDGDAVVLDYADYTAAQQSVPEPGQGQGATGADEAVDAAVVAAWEAEKDSAQLQALLGIALEGEMYDIVADCSSSRSILSSIK